MVALFLLFIFVWAGVGIFIILAGDIDPPDGFNIRLVKLCFILGPVITPILVFLTHMNGPEGFTEAAKKWVDGENED